MLLTFFYMIATSIQSWRLSFLRARLSTIFQGTSQSCPSIMLYTKSSRSKDENQTKISLNNESKLAEHALSSHLCINKTAAKLGDLIWSRDDTSFCTIFPEQKVDISQWLTYHYGQTIFPLYAHNNGQNSNFPGQKVHVLVEADYNIFRPFASLTAMKLEDFGLIIAWTADTNFNLVLQTDIDHMTKFFVAAMQGQRFINNGLLLTRIESVLVSGKPCVYDSERFNSPPSKKLSSKVQWETYVHKLKILSNTARLVKEQNKPLEVEGIPEVSVSPGTKTLSLETLIIPEEIEINESNGSKGSPTPCPPPTPAMLNTGTNKTESTLLPQLATSIDIQSAKIQDVPVTSSVQMEKSKPVENLSGEKKEHRELTAPQDIPKLSSAPIASSTMISNLAFASAFPSSSTKKTSFIYSNNMKPPNVLIYADSAVALNNVTDVLTSSLEVDHYTIYPLTLDVAKTDAWIDDATLVVVCGNVGNDVGMQLVEYIARGGKLLALCSDMLHSLIPSFKTAEVREHELVSFSYGKWKHVRMMHHIFCYQASPVKTRFSQDQEDSKISCIHPPTSASIKDKTGKLHTFNVEVLGTEETWHTPSILLANLPTSGGKAVFSQIHLEADPQQYEFEENKFIALKQSNAARLEILNDLLNSHLGIKIRGTPKPLYKYSPGFFLGRHELKLKLLERFRDKIESNDVLKLPNIQLQFCGRNTKVQDASSSFLPIMLHQCPDNFSTIDYFENLKTNDIGRLVIYADVIKTSMAVAECYLQHGFAVIPRLQTEGKGRGKNSWLSPKGCAMFTLQLHIPVNSILGSRISLIQHITAVSVVSAIKSIPGYQDIDLRVKWPNDIYAGVTTKLGGSIVTARIESDFNMCNIGTGVNLSNSSPTCCINNIIKIYNEKTGSHLSEISFERYFALVFTELERIINNIQSGNINHFLELYYKHWMHTDSVVTIQTTNGKSQEVKILGIDDFGFLQVQGKTGKPFSVHPDGNSFNLLKGLITPK